MPSLILLIAFGLGIAFFATQNTGSIHIVFGSYILKDIPLYIIVVGSILLGVFISWLVSIVDTLFTLFTLHNKDSMLKKSQHTIDQLQEKNFHLEKEIAKLHDTKAEAEDSSEEGKNENQSFLGHTKAGLSFSH